jgi:hypothetical protein
VDIYRWVHFVDGYLCVGMWIVLEQFFRPPYTIMSVVYISSCFDVTEKFPGIPSRKVHSHRVSAASMLFDGIRMERNGVSVSFFSLACD